MTVEELHCDCLVLPVEQKFTLLDQGRNMTVGSLRMADLQGCPVELYSGVVVIALPMDVLSKCRKIEHY